MMPYTSFQENRRPLEDVVILEFVADPDVNYEQDNVAMGRMIQVWQIRDQK